MFLLHGGAKGVCHGDSPHSTHLSSVTTSKQVTMEHMVIKGNR